MYFIYVSNPILEWRWKVNNILTTGDVSRKSGDDYAARIYVTFAYDSSKLSFGDRIKYKAAKMLYGEYPPTGALNYIWGSKAPKNQFVPNPYTDRAMMVVVESGESYIGKKISVIVTSALQTSAGRMIFARPAISAAA